jgi:hypothetical protein
MARDLRLLKLLITEGSQLMVYEANLLRPERTNSLSANLLSC